MQNHSPFALAIHGGAGTITRSSLSEEMDQQYRAALHQALHTGQQVLQSGGTALAAVEAAVVVLEDCPLFNAGCGSVFNKTCRHEMDAALMCGRTLAAGAVAGVQNIRNPVKLASQVLHGSDHVFLSHQGA